MTSFLVQPAWINLPCQFQEIYIPKSTVHDIIHKRVQLRAYTIQIVQHQHPNDKIRHAEFADAMLCHIDIGFLNCVAFSDEVTFQTFGKVHQHNPRI